MIIVLMLWIVTIISIQGEFDRENITYNYEPIATSNSHSHSWFYFKTDQNSKGLLFVTDLSIHKYDYRVCRICFRMQRSCDFHGNYIIHKCNSYEISILKNKLTIHPYEYGLGNYLLSVKAILDSAYTRESFREKEIKDAALINAKSVLN